MPCPKEPLRWMPFAFWPSAVLLVLLSAQPFAGGWNDGSRLATVEALVDHGSLAIDESIFVRVPQTEAPYRDPISLRHGTLDKLWIAGRFYSDKPYFPSFLMAAVYHLWQALGGAAAALRPDLFCLLLTWCSSGLAHLVALVCVYRLGRRLGLPTHHALLLTASLGFATVSLVYARHVNNHIMLLGVMAALMLHLAAFADEHAAGASGRWRLLLIGLLGGLGYSLDQGLAPVLMLCLGTAVLWRTRSLAALGLVFLGALPCLAAHHWLNYAVGGTFKPANAVPEYLAYAGSPFNPDNMTGVWRGFGQLLVYPLSLLYGKHGFLSYNLPQLLSLPAAVIVWRRVRGSRPEIAFAVCFCMGGWLMYGVFSNNYGGACCSIRWFVPFLAPGFYLIALLLRERPTYARDLALLSVWGCVLAASHWFLGPWSNKVLLWYWPVQGLALLSWLLCRRRWARAEAIAGAGESTMPRAA